MLIVRLLKYIWAFPTTAVGLPFVAVALATGGHVQVIDGVLEVHGSMVAWVLRHCTLLKGGAAAITLGHVVLARNLELLEETRSHERIHVSQCELWGPVFIPAYLTASLWLYLRGREPYEDNPFELEARRRSETGPIQVASDT